MLTLNYRTYNHHKMNFHNMASLLRLSRGPCTHSTKGLLEFLAFPALEQAVMQKEGAPFCLPCMPD